MFVLLVVFVCLLTASHQFAKLSTNIKIGNFIHSFIHSFIQVTGISISVDSTAALILAGPQNTAAISGQSTKLTCTSDRGTCDDVTWARTDQNDASIILHATGQMLEVQYR